MPKYVIRREIEGAGEMTPEQLQDAARTSNAALAKLAPLVQWQQSYVTDHGTFCVYIAENEDMVREHAQLSGFPANAIHEVRGVIDPTTAD